MLLCVNHGIFYEFIPADQFFKAKPKRLSLADVKIGENYVIILNTNPGLWGYNIGDTVKFVSIDLIELLLAGELSTLHLHLASMLLLKRLKVFKKSS